MHFKFASGLALAAALISTGFAAAQTPPDGSWRGELRINEDPVPFNFEIAGKGARRTLTLVNGDRHDDYELTQRPNGEWGAVLGTFSSELVLRPGADSENWTGSFRNLASNRQAFDLPFTAGHGRTDRFAVSTARAPVNVNGAWRIDVVSKRPAPHQVAELRQDGDRVTGVLLTVVGDSRRLQGNIVGDELFLSTFTGPAPVYLRAKVKPDGTLDGSLSFGAFVTLKFTGAKDDAIALPDPFTVTEIRDSATPLDLILPDVTGRQTALSDPRFRGKVVVLQILGSWCPNSIDESRFLTDWRGKNLGRGVEVVSAAFEVASELDAARPALEAYRRELDVEHTLLYGGGQDKVAAGAHFPQLSAVNAYPTLLFLDRQGRVRAIHSGFSSPDTGVHYEAFVARFNATVDALLNEPVSVAQAGVPSGPRG